MENQSARFDLTQDMVRCHGKMTFDGEKMTINTDGSEITYALSDMTEVSIVVEVGCAYLLCKQTSGEEKVLCRMTMDFVDEGGEWCKALNHTIKTGILTPVEKAIEHFCPKCGKRLPEDVHTCIFCVNKLGLIRHTAMVLKPYKKLFIFSVFILAVSQGLLLLAPIFNRQLIDDVLRPATGTLGMVLGIVGLMFITKALGQVFSVWSNVALSRVAARFCNDLRSLLYDKIQSFSMSSLSKKKPGDLMRRVMDDTQTVKIFMCGHARWLLIQAVSFIGVTLILLVTDPILTLMVFAPIPIAFVAIRQFWKIIIKRFDKQWRLASKSSSILHDIIKGIRVVKVFGHEEKEIEKYRKSCYEFADISSRNEQLWAIFFPLVYFTVSFGEFLVLYFGGQAVMGHTMTIGEMVQFMMYLGLVYQPINTMIALPRWFAEAVTSMTKICEILDEQSEIKDLQEAYNDNLKGQIAFNDVTFGYKSYEPILKNISIDIAKGEMIGIVGPSGVGKSTLINLLMRLYDVNSGSITIDGKDIKQISQQTLHENMGVVFQETYLFAGSIYDNIAYAKPTATPDEIIGAATVANAHEFIMKLPDGYNTSVGENGYSLSGGERQRVAIARAILRDPAILILDEATSALDMETESKIQEALARLIKGRTTIAIAHRLSTLRNANRLIVLEKGKLAEAGTHAELLRQQGIYYRLVMAQRQTTKLAKQAEATVDNAS